MPQNLENDYDIIISGAGIPGASLALKCAQAGLRVALIDSRPGFATRMDTRTTAFLPESLAFLNDLSILETIRDEAQPLRAMRLMNDQGPARDRPKPLIFNGHKDQPLALNLPNQVVGHALDAALENRVHAYWGQSVIQAGYLGQGRNQKARLSLNQGYILTAGLAVAADGRTSPLRKALGIRWQNLSAGQIAITAHLHHRDAHEDTSTEFHRYSGPMTFVPLPGNGHQSALVWCQRAAVAHNLKELDSNSFLRRVQIASRGILGHLSNVENRAAFPVRPGIATRFSSGPFVILAEAAHVLPPLLAQGMNLSLSDVAALWKAIDSKGPNAQAAAIYERKRWGDAVARLSISEGLNHFLRYAPPPLQYFYGLGHSALASSPQARDFAVKIGQRGYQMLPKSTTLISSHASKSD